MLGPCILNDGYDAKRPQPGICIDKTNPESLQNLISWNERFSKGDDRYPMVNSSVMRKGSLAATLKHHLTLF